MRAEASIRYSVPESFDRAVQLVSNSVRKRGMRIAGQLDVSRRLQRSLAMMLEPCKVLFVLPGPVALSAPARDPRAAIFLPLHIVISGDGKQSEIQILNRVQREDASAAIAPNALVVEAQRQLTDAIEAIGLRTTILV